MRRLLVVATLLAGSLLPVASSAATPTPLHDWSLFVVTAGPHGASNIRFLHRVEARGPVSREASLGATGVLQSVYDPQNQRTPFLSCGIVHGGVGHYASTRETWTFKGPIALNPGARLAELIFFVNARITSERLTAIAGSGSIHVQRVFGSGSRAIAFAPDSTGNTTPARITTGSGLAGSFVTSTIAPATAGVASWTAPDGSTGSFLDDGAPTSACGDRSPWNPAFAGDKGRWMWSWRGVGQGQVGRGLVAWAPIGPYWSLFRAGSVALADVGVSSDATGPARTWPSVQFESGR